MKNIDQMPLAPCGLDCNSCNLYRASFDRSAAEALVEWFRSRGTIGKTDGAEAVMAKAPLCEGCWGDPAVRWCGDCALFSCAVAKKLPHCGACDQFPCKDCIDWIGDMPHHKAAMEYLKKLHQT